MALNQESLERLWQHIIARLGRKVDKEDGKGLSSCDFTAEEKEKLKDLETNTRADWNETDPTSASYIVNTPTEVENNVIAEWDGVITEDMTPVNGYLYKVSNYNDTDPSKISGITVYLPQQGEIFLPLDEKSLIYTEQDGISALYYDSYFYVVSAPIAEFSEAGTYLMYAEQEGYVKALNGKINVVKEKNISKKIARLTDLPCGEIPGGIYWDGDTTNKESVQLEDGTFLYKVSDEFYNIEDLLGKKIGIQTQGFYQEVSLSLNDIQSINEDLLIIHNAIIIALKETILEGVGTFSPGTYFAKKINENKTTSENSFSYISYLETDSTTKILDEKYIPDTIARKSDIVQSDWNENEESGFSFIKNRPFYEIDHSISWDGNTDGLESVQLDDEASLYKVSDYIPTIEELIGQFIIRQTVVDGIILPKKEITIGSNNIVKTPNSNVLLVAFSVYIVPEDNITFDSIQFNHKGVYFMKSVGSKTVYISNMGIVNLKRIDEKYLPKNIKANWDTNDETDLSYINNRTHWTEQIIENIIPETTVTFGAATEPGKDTGTATGSATQIYPELGEVFDVEWNGTNYHLEVGNYTKTDGSFGHGIGNTGMFGGSLKRYPFLIGFLTEAEAAAAGYTYMVWVNDGSTSATFSVSGVTGEEVHQLDEKFIPDTIARKEDIITPIQSNWVTEDSSDLSYIKNKPMTFNQKVIEWDGNTDGIVSALFVTDTNRTFYKVSEEIINRVDLLGAQYMLVTDRNGAKTEEIVTCNNANNWNVDGAIFGDHNGGYGAYRYIASISKAGAMMYDGTIFPETGTYFLTYSKGTTTQKITALVYNEKRIFEDIIPDTIARVEDINTAINNITHPITSVNGQTGDIEITAASLGALTSAPVSSVNGNTGDVVLTASDVGALPDTTEIPSIEGLASENYVETKIAELVNSAPETLNTLNELATALGNDPNFATTIAAEIGTKANANDLTSHTENKSNPHNVTAAQIGAATEEYVNNAISNITAPDVSGQISTHNTDTAAHNDIREAIANLNTLVGDTSVSAQIESAINALREEILGGAW